MSAPIAGPSVGGKQTILELPVHFNDSEDVARQIKRAKVVAQDSGNPVF